MKSKPISVKLSQKPKESFTGCLICGEGLIYGESVMRACALCGKKSLSNAVCRNGHYVCDACHAYGSLAAVMPLLRESRERDPLLLLERVMELPSVHMHGPEHHSIVPCVLLTAYRNCGGDINYDGALSEACKRAKNVPGGACGYWGVCGAAAGAGIYASVLLGSDPLNSEAWPLPQRLTSDILSRIAELGGPRCCKRTSRIAVEAAAEFTRSLRGVDMPVSHPVCKYVGMNRQCIGSRCPYFPKNKADKGI